jgi:hypothetical protein
MRSVLMLFLLTFSMAVAAQEAVIAPELLQIKERLDSISGFTADLALEVDVNFINMPRKTGTLTYQKGSPAEIQTEDFMLVPKKGLDFSLDQLLEYPYFTVDRGVSLQDGDSLRVINIIPTTDKADFSIAELTLNLSRRRIQRSAISTKRDGSYEVFLKYGNARAVLPDQIRIQFEVERIRIPLSFLGQDVEVDRKMKRSEDIKKGTITLYITNYRKRIESE